MTDQVEQFLDGLYEADRDTHRLVNQAILVLERNGPGEGRPLVDRARQWSRWYRSAIPEAEQLYALYLKERQGETDDERD